MEAGLKLSPRLQRELDGLRKAFAEMAFVEAGYWVFIPRFGLPDGWSEREAEVSFQVSAGYPTAPPYGFYVPSRLRVGGNMPSWQYPCQNRPPFPGDWAFFSWAIDGQWIVPTSSGVGGCNLRAFVDSFRTRLGEGA